VKNNPQGLRIRWSGVRTSPGAPVISKGYAVFWCSPFSFLLPYCYPGCINSLLLTSHFLILKISLPKIAFPGVRNFPTSLFALLNGLTASLSAGRSRAWSTKRNRPNSGRSAGRGCPALTSSLSNDLLKSGWLKKGETLGWHQGFQWKGAVGLKKADLKLSIDNNFVNRIITFILPFFAVPQGSGFMEFSGRSLQRGPIVPNFILKSELNPGAKVLFAVLLNLCGQRDFCWPSQAYLSKALGQCVRTVQNHLCELTTAGFIRTESWRFGSSKIYRLLLHPAILEDLNRSQIARVTDITEKNTQDSPAKTESFHTNLIVKEEKKYTPPSETRELTNCGSGKENQVETTFQLIWDVWPVKEARKKAFRIWRRLWKKKALPDLQTIQSSIKANQESNPRWKRGFVPYFSTWLRDGRWDDHTEKAKTVLLQNENESGVVTAEVNKSASPALAPTQAPDHVIRQFDEALSIWPLKPPLAGLSMCRGLWLFLHSHKLLPSIEVILYAAQKTTLSFSRWLYEYKEEISRSFTKAIC